MSINQDQSCKGTTVEILGLGPTPSLITLYPPPLFYLFFFPQRIDQLLKYCETYFLKISSSLGFPGGSAVKTPPANAGHVGHIPNR